jgi:hypothetical protein
VKHVVELEHVTPLNIVASAPDGSGLGRTVHPVPLNNSISDLVVTPPSTLPTAKQRVEDLHATSLRLGTPPFHICGLVISDHVEPFQRWMMVAGVGLSTLPTAKQSPEIHVTPLSALPVAPAGFGLATIDHAVPFQRSMSVLIWLFEPERPTAKQFVAERHETSWSSL